MLFINSFNVTLITLTFIIFFSLLFYFFFQGQIKIRGIKIQNQRFEIFKKLNEAFGAIKEIKTLQAEKKVSNFFNEIFDKQELNQRYYDFVSKLARPFLEFLSVLFLSIIIIISFKEKLIEQTFLFDLTLFSICLIRFIPAFNAITKSYAKLKFLKPSFNLIHEEISQYKINLEKQFNNKIRENYLSENVSKNIVFESLKIENLDYSYGEKSILNKFSFEIFKKDKVVISGESGTGKTTLCDIILGLQENFKGKILINDSDKIIFSQQWKKIISYVPQNIFLIDDTILKNIVFDQNINGRSEKDVEKLLEIVCLDKEFSDINRNIGELGVKISGGQKQRLAIARALFNEPQVIVLDEATGGIDKFTEKNIINNILKHSPNITIIMVTHRFNESLVFDKIIQL